MIIESIVVFLLTFAFVIFLSKEILKVVYTKRSGDKFKKLDLLFLVPLFPFLVLLVALHLYHNQVPWILYSSLDISFSLFV